tara:strand:- start:23 stop:634 length:612 start_codon:yes stop_codon:yes gene_type:complete
VKIFISKSHKFIEHYPRKYIGRLFTPDVCARPHETTESNMEYGIDNGCFVGFKEEKFLRLLNKIQNKDNCKFVAAPDVVADYQATLDNFNIWSCVISNMNFPLAIVLQDGATIKNTPWQDIQAVFVGGSTDWKLGEEARKLIHYAKTNNLWVHVGRVNSIKRLRYCKENKVDSVDGLAFAKYNKTYVDKAIRFLEIPLENKLF